MTLHAYITQPDKFEMIIKFIRNGIIDDGTIIRHIHIYQDFMLMSEPKLKRYEIIGKKYRLNPWTVSKIVRKMRNDIK